jgi:hypothetical protein
VPKFVEIVRRDGLKSAEEVSVDGGPWVVAARVEGLLDAAVSGGETARPDFGGTFDRRDLPRILYRYAVCRSTGRMTLETGQKRTEIFWRRGRPEYVTSNLRSELLGEYLVDRRLVPRARLNEALNALSDHGGRLGDALVHLNLLTPHDLFDALSSQVKAKLLEVFSWPSGQYAFYRGEYTTAQIVPLELNDLWPSSKWGTKWGTQGAVVGADPGGAPCATGAASGAASNFASLVRAAKLGNGLVANDSPRWAKAWGGAFGAKAGSAAAASVLNAQATGADAISKLTLTLP